MFEPIKIIHCIPNSRNRIHFKLYIFLGSEINNKISKILKIIQNLNFVEMLDTLNKKDYQIMAEKFGDEWWKFFFPAFHLRSQFKKFKMDKYKRKFGAKFFSILEFPEMLGGLIKGLQYDSDSDDEEEYEENVKEVKIETENIALKRDKRTEHQLKKDLFLFKNDLPIKKDEITKIEFNDKNNELNYDQSKSEIFEKIYIFDRFLFKTDTIESIKEKIVYQLELMKISVILNYF